MSHSIRTEIDICCGHRLHLHKGKCNRLHGHNYRVEVWIEGQPADSGMIIDFGIIKPKIKEVLAVYDHRMILWEKDPKFSAIEAAAGIDSIVRLEVAPSAENLAKIWYQELVDNVSGAITKVRVWETQDNYAEYSAY